MTSNIFAARAGLPNNRRFSHFVRYQTYLTPPSNPFREGKSKLQLLREAFLVLFIVALILTVVLRCVYQDDSTTLLEQPSPAAGTQQQLSGSFETVHSQMQKLRGEIQQAKGRLHNAYRRHDEDPTSEQRDKTSHDQEGSKHEESDVLEAAQEHSEHVNESVNSAPETLAIEPPQGGARDEASQLPESKEKHKEDESSSAAKHQDKAPEEEVELKDS
mmetsp:Transcript_19215/g.31917  ORF Transcript_19215/g.31917 Transcript_19215/m.31917 type:complete len:217 (+) Transcript_19215:98-748(+)